jgi:hypothetical protein
MPVDQDQRDEPAPASSDPSCELDVLDHDVYGPPVWVNTSLPLSNGNRTNPGHTSWGRAPAPRVRIHNYPPGWGLPVGAIPAFRQPPGPDWVPIAQQWGDADPPQPYRRAATWGRAAPPPPYRRAVTDWSTSVRRPIIDVDDSTHTTHKGMPKKCRARKTRQRTKHLKRKHSKKTRRNK